jgi:hypothetical protein
MSALSAYLEGKVANYILGRVAYTAPTTVYLALYTAAPSEAGGGTEVSGTGYVRASVANTVSNFPDAVLGVKSNGIAITFPVVSDPSGWGNVTHWGMFDELSGGNLLFYGALAPVTLINHNDQLIIPSGDLDITFE